MLFLSLRLTWSTAATLPLLLNQTKRKWLYKQRGIIHGDLQYIQRENNGSLKYIVPVCGVFFILLISTLLSKRLHTVDVIYIRRVP